MLDRGIFGRFGEEEETRRHGLNANPSPGFDLDDDDEAEEKLLDEEYSDPIYDINYDDLDSLYYEEILYPPHEFECGAEEENDLDMPRDFECDEDAQPDLEDFKEPLGFDGYGHESPDLENFKDPLGFDGYGHGHESPDLEDSYLPVDFEDDGLPPLSEKDWEEICGDEDEDDEYDLVFGLNCAAENERLAYFAGIISKMLSLAAKYPGDAHIKTEYEKPFSSAAVELPDPPADFDAAGVIREIASLADSITVNYTPGTLLSVTAFVFVF